MFVTFVSYAVQYERAPYPSEFVVISTDQLKIYPLEFASIILFVPTPLFSCLAEREFHLPGHHHQLFRSSFPQHLKAPPSDQTILRTMLPVLN